MTANEIIEYAKLSDFKLLKGIVPLLRGFAILYGLDGKMQEQFGSIPRNFPRDLPSIQSYLVAHPSAELPTDCEIAVGEFNGFVVHVLDGHLISNYPLSALVIAIPGGMHMDKLLSSLPTGVIKLDSHWDATYCNEYAEVMLGLSSEEIQGRGWLSTIKETVVINALTFFQNPKHLGSPFKTNTDLISPMGRKRNLSIQISASYNFDHSVNEYYLVFQDVTNETAANQKAQYLASHDALTGLKNRAYLMQKIEEMISQTDHILKSALIYIDLNDFKLVNDTYGHEAGDTVLKVAGQRLTNVVRDGDIVARIGGDEFVLFLRNVTEEDLLKTVAGKIQKAINQPISLGDGITIDLICSFGLSHGAAISLIMDDQNDINIDNWLRSADIAMYISKEKHDGSYEVFDEEFHRVKLAEKKQFQTLKEVLDTESVVIYFQPIIKDERVYSVEALARFQHKDLSIPPDQVIALAKKYNFQARLFDELFLAGLRAYQALIDKLDEATERPKLNINVDVEVLQSCDFAENCFALVEELELDTSDIYLEITEKVLEFDTNVVTNNINELKRLGFKLSMDDFGTGYSSITRLINYSFDQIKIDRGFFTGAPENAKLRSALTAATMLGQALQIDVLGEGVETQAEFELAKALNIQLIQGYFFQSPCDIDSIKEYICNIN